jgi:protein TonB
LAITLLTVAARSDWRMASETEITFTPKPYLLAEDVLVTKHTPERPPPPRPPVPVAVPDELVLDDTPFAFDSLPDAFTGRGTPPPEAPRPTEPPPPEVFVLVEEMPQLVGGLATLARHIRYPEIAKRAGVEGWVIVRFIVDEMGRVREAEVVRGIGAGCDEEALRALHQMEFTPGKQRGQPVAVKMSLPVTFRLN